MLQFKTKLTCFSLGFKSCLLCVFLFDLFVTAVYVMASLALSDSLLIIQAECNEDVSMKCEAVQDKSYRSVTWYKVGYSIP